MKITKNHVVSIHYTLKDNDGKVIDSSQNAEPLQYIQGMKNIIVGLEKELEGKTKGDKLQVKVSPEEGYGKRNDQLVQEVPKAEFPEPDKVEVGMQFQMDSNVGPMIVTVAEVKADAIVLDGNHPLADYDLNFDVEIVDIREATEDELAHGHVHGPGCSH